MTEQTNRGSRVLLISGPNLRILGTREPEIYGTATLLDHVNRASSAAERRQLVLEHFQSDHEGAIVEKIASSRASHSAIIINPGAFTHYSWAIHDALAAFEGPVVELHLSNPNARESWRQTSVVSPVATAVIAGLGAEGYSMAVDAVAALLAQ